ncbi:MAG: GHKL domain-containing protein [Flavobacteriaceae bacterium]|nr:GHKL domain-containing protein [Flavobacteriaceae bacterium]
MKIHKLSLRIRIFLSMIFLILLTSFLVVVVTLYQYKEQTDEYNKGRLHRKVSSVKSSIDYWLKNGNTFIVSPKYLRYIFRNRIKEIAKIENIDINIYDLNGCLTVSSKEKIIDSEQIPFQLPENTLSELLKSEKHSFVQSSGTSTKNLQSFFSYISDLKNTPLGIINVQYIQDNTAQDKDLREFLYRILFIYVIMLFITITVAYFLSSYITQSIKAITTKIEQTKLHKRNEKIILENASAEIETLITAYNSMVDELEKSVSKLAKSEREQAWREMAKQIAHEIKNPLTPMRLSTQNLERKFDPKDPEIKQKISDFSRSMIQQIDTLSAIASAFSNFAKMPAQKMEELNMVEVIKSAIQIFSEDYIHFYSKKEEVITQWDKSQLIRIITNLLKNSTQALTEKTDKKIDVTLYDESENIIITVADNGKGIAEEDQKKVFEPKFTTKSSGMGLGLAIVKNIIEIYGGTIDFSSEVNVGTVFKIVLPKNQS